MAVWHNFGLQTQAGYLAAVHCRERALQGAVTAPCWALACAGGPAGLCLHGTAAVPGPLGIVQVWCVLLQTCTTVRAAGVGTAACTIHHHCSSMSLVFCCAHTLLVWMLLAM